MGTGYEGTLFMITGKNDVPWLVSHKQCAHYSGGGLSISHGDNAYTVGEMVNHPHFRSVRHGNRDRFQAYGDGESVLQRCPLQVKDFQTVIRCVNRIKPFSIRRKHEGTHVPAFKCYEGRVRDFGCHGCRNRSVRRKEDGENKEDYERGFLTSIHAGVSAGMS
jgi:hypothetical protein